MPVTAITDARSPRLDLPFLYPGQAQKEAFVNEALVRLDALVQPSVVAITGAPPADPAAGDSHIVADPATGAWAGHEGQIAVWAQTHWLFTTPPDGALVFDRSSACLRFYRMSDGWQQADAPAPPVGGGVQDVEVRAALAETVAALQQLGIFAP